MESSLPVMLAPDEIAKRLNISRSAAYRLCLRVGAYRVGRSLRIAERTLLEYLEAHRTKGGA